MCFDGVTVFFLRTGKTGVIGQGTAPVFSPDDFSFLCAFFHRPGKGRGPDGGWRGVLINNYKLVFIYLVTTLVLSKSLLENQALFFQT